MIWICELACAGIASAENWPGIESEERNWLKNGRYPYDDARRLTN